MMPSRAATPPSNVPAGETIRPPRTTRSARAGLMILRVLLPTDRRRGALDRQRIAQPVAEQVDADDQREQREARDVDQPRLEEDHVLRLRRSSIPTRPPAA